MKKILYLHGLESEQGGPKVDFLATKGLVYAPKMDYENPLMFATLYRQILIDPPDIIVGSSMGGYFADALGSHFNIKVLLFNPALHSRSIQPEGVTYGETNWERHFVVGTEDTVINPKFTKVFKDIAKSWTEIEGMGHRTPLDVFINMYNKHA